jgi:hypothetical protein
MKHAFPVLIAAAAFGLAAAQQPSAEASPPPFARVRIEGSLSPSTELDCIPGSDVSPAHTPPDLYAASLKCMASGDFNRAVRLTTIAELFGRFDASRVSDPTARGGPQVLLSRTLAAISQSQLQSLRTALKEALADPKVNESLCVDLTRIGPPAYYPRYLVLHGLAAYTGQTSPDTSVIKEFDAAKTWTILKASARCTQ